MARHGSSASFAPLLALTLALCGTPGCLPASLSSGSAFADAVTAILWSLVLGGVIAGVVYVVASTREARRRNWAYRAGASTSADVLATGSARCAFTCAAATEHWAWLRVAKVGARRALSLRLELRITASTRLLFEHAGTMRLDDEGFPEDWPLEPGTVGIDGEHVSLARFFATPGEEVVAELRYERDPAVSLAALELWVAPTPPP